MTSRSHALPPLWTNKILSYLCPANPNPSQSLSSLSSYNTSGHAIGGVLSQEQDRKWKPIAFLSRMMQLAEWNYKIYDKKLLAIVEVLTKWRQYLLNAMEPFEVWTDHENLKYF